MNKIKYTDLASKKITLTKFIELLNSRIAKQTYFHLDDYLIVYDCLKEINFKGLIKNKDSVEFYCIKTLKAIMSPLAIPNAETPIRSFITIVFEFKDLPIVHKTKLEIEVKEDILKLESLISHYQTLSSVNNKPYSHEDNKQLVFYKRALKKKEEVLKYIVVRQK